MVLLRLYLFKNRTMYKFSLYLTPTEVPDTEEALSKYLPKITEIQH